MTRPARHTAIRPFRLSKATVDAHKGHLPTPFLGCPLCFRRSTFQGLDIKWSSPRQA